MQLKDVCTVFSGYAFKNFNDEKLGKPIIKIGNITPNFEIDTFDCQYTLEKPNEKYLSKKDDIYIALSGATTGKIGLMKKEGYFINQRVGIVRPINKDIPIEYLYYFLQSKTLKILDDAAGAAQPNISPKDISNYIFKTYDKVQMNNIVGVLSDLTKSIKHKKCEFDHLNELIKSRFISQEVSV